MVALAVFGHLALVEHGLAQAQRGTVGAVVEIVVDVALFLGTVDLVVVGRGVDLRQQRCLAQRAVLLPGLLLVHGRLVDRSLVLQEIPGLLEVHRSHRQGNSCQTSQDASSRHFIAP
ncbi:hypothetical protein FQZ97_1085350 [compost metagenome]